MERLTRKWVSRFCSGGVGLVPKQKTTLDQKRFNNGSGKSEKDNVNMEIFWMDLSLEQNIFFNDFLIRLLHILSCGASIRPSSWPL
jgi:hypothetical protein